MAQLQLEASRSVGHPGHEPHTPAAPPHLALVWDSSADLAGWAVAQGLEWLAVRYQIFPILHAEVSLGKILNPGAPLLIEKGLHIDAYRDTRDRVDQLCFSDEKYKCVRQAVNGEPNVSDPSEL
ncbi:unnamed protein product [Pleuronectes platessa]|uniref:Uncharacterized protein n=1 Tax=Pleuronectes platessa TaxID=8262 RepID=A0A9N7VT21_PLEPL|nr:unnamed protein product [Pleuronectes platessa]